MQSELRGKNLRNAAAVPFKFGFTYVHPPVDQVAPSYQLQATVDAHPYMARITTLDEAIDLYMEVFANAYSSELVLRRRTNLLRRFQRLFYDQHGIELLDDLSYPAVQHTVDGLVNARNGTPISEATRKDFKSAVRAFGRFLFQSGLIANDVFFELTT